MAYFFFTVQVLFIKQLILLNRTKIDVQSSVMNSNQSKCTLYWLEVSKVNSVCWEIIHFAILSLKKNMYAFLFFLQGLGNKATMIGLYIFPFFQLSGVHLWMSFFFLESLTLVCQERKFLCLHKELHSCISLWRFTLLYSFISSLIWCNLLYLSSKQRTHFKWIKILIIK